MNVYFGYLNLKYYEDSLKILCAKSFQRYLNFNDCSTKKTEIYQSALNNFKKNEISIVLGTI